MGYSLKQSEVNKSKQGAEFTYFPDEEWSRYPFASEQNTKWVSPGEIRSFSARRHLCNRNGRYQLVQNNAQAA